MFRIEPTALYSLDDLQAALGEAMTARQFVDSAKPAKRFKNLFWGADLIAAIQEKKPINEAAEPVPMESLTVSTGQGRHGHIAFPKKSV